MKDKFNEHRHTIDNSNTAVEHFLSFPSHTLLMTCNQSPLKNIFSNHDSICKAKEAFLISKGKTLVPHGLNNP